MKIDHNEIKRIFENRPTVEILEISPKERERLHKKAESFLLEKSSRFALNGSGITDFDRALVRSFLEVFVRNEAMKHLNNTSVAAIDLDMYNEAMLAFSQFMEQMKDYHELRTLWIEEIKSYLSNVFVQSKRVFEPYLVGELCESLYLDNNYARSVLEELANEKLIRVTGKEHKQNLFEKNF